MASTTEPGAEATAKLTQYLSEAYATELMLIRTLQAHITMSPAGDYRGALEHHLEETRSHAERLEARLGAIRGERKPAQAGVDTLRGVLAQALAFGKAPIDIVRGVSAEEKLLKNAKDECATEAFEIATYDALEQLARATGDDETARLAASIRSDEERMLERLRELLPDLTAAVVKAEIEHEPTFEPGTTGAAEAVRRAREKLRGNVVETARRAADRGRAVVDDASAKVEQARGGPSAEDLPISGYDDLNAEEIVAELGDQSPVDLRRIESYERAHDNRRTVLDKLGTLRGGEPWAGYDGQSVTEIKHRLGGASSDLVECVRDYERAHKNRVSVLQAAERQTPSNPAHNG